MKLSLRDVELSSITGRKYGEWVQSLGVRLLQNSRSAAARGAADALRTIAAAGTLPRRLARAAM